MDEKAIEIIEKSIGVFMQFGIKSITMDDIARHLSISKKTIYKNFSDKNDLVIKALSYHTDCDLNRLCSIKELNLNAIDENFEISKMVLENLKNIHPSVWYDLQKYHPEAWKIMEKYKSETIYNWVCDNLKKGIAQGLYRNDLKITIIAGIYISRIDDLFKPNLFNMSTYSFAEIYLEIFRYHIRGIASDKGIEVLKERVKKENQSKND